MGRFLSTMEVEQRGEKWALTKPLIFDSLLMGKITVPAAFETDFASVPRVPIAYLIAGNTASKASVVHDYLYSGTCSKREDADAVFLEAMKASGEPFLRRYAMYWAVRLAGASRFKKSV